MKLLQVLLALTVAIGLTVGFYVAFAWVMQVGLAAFGISFSLYQCLWVIVFFCVIIGILKSIFGGE